MTTNLTDPIFHDDDAARSHFEAIRWPNGPVCPHCGAVEASTLVNGKSHRKGMYQCNACREPFSVMVGSVMERSHIPLAKWALAFHLMAASKKGVSAHQLMRTLGIGSYRTAWFMAHRIREAMKLDSKAGPIGGEVRMFHVENATKADIRDVLVRNVDRKSALHTDESALYTETGREFADHRTVKHSAGEYVRYDEDTIVHSNTVENVFSVFKRGMTGVYHFCGEAHLHRYLAEFDFRYNNRSALGVEDTERAAKAVKGAEGKRLMYRQPREAGHA
jgi:transposase-like protein